MSEGRHPLPDAALDADIAILGKVAATRAPTAADCAYAAGFIDGEGNIVIAKNQKGSRGSKGATYNMRVMASQDALAPLLFLRERWGGSIVAKRPRPNGKINHHWSCFARQAAKFLRDVLPFLILKRGRAELALEFQSRIFWPGAGGHTEEYRSELEGLRARMLALNGYGEEARP